MPELKAGDCIWINVPPPDGHIFVVLFDCDPWSKNTIVVPINSYKSDRHDGTTRLYDGDHKFVTHDSYVNYRMSEIIIQKFFDSICETGDARMLDEKFSEPMFQRIFSGVTKSGFTKPDILIAHRLRLSRKD